MRPIDAYAALRDDLVASAAGMDDAAVATVVPACPLWSVRDVYAHLAGLAADVLAGRMDGAGSPAWSARQVEGRRGHPFAEVVDELDREGRRLEDRLRADGGMHERIFTFDIWSHTQDVAGALGRSGGGPDDAATAMLAGAALEVLAGRAAAVDGPAVRVVTPTREVVIGDGNPAAVLRTSDYELLRSIFGRRSVAQLRSGHWEGDPDQVLARMLVFPAPDHDLAD